ncbi:uncharacterized protein METZ01_LOCUS463840 [marine metagenome]|uniref:Uncharacterized protein n=1 Tax=marine metagenome TaxID=408172 RepID=A0A383ASS3_9ZZZZ
MTNCIGLHHTVDQKLILFNLMDNDLYGI